MFFFQTECHLFTIGIANEFCWISALPQGLSNVIVNRRIFTGSYTIPLCRPKAYDELLMIRFHTPCFPSSSHGSLKRVGGDVIMQELLLLSQSCTQLPPDTNVSVNLFGRGGNPKGKVLSWDCMIIMEKISCSCCGAMLKRIYKWAGCVLANVHEAM